MSNIKKNNNSQSKSNILKQTEPDSVSFKGIREGYVGYFDPIYHDVFEKYYRDGIETFQQLYDHIVGKGKDFKEYYNKNKVLLFRRKTISEKDMRSIIDIFQKDLPFLEEILSTSCDNVPILFTKENLPLFNVLNSKFRNNPQFVENLYLKLGNKIAPFIDITSRGGFAMVENILLGISIPTPSLIRKLTNNSFHSLPEDVMKKWPKIIAK